MKNFEFVVSEGTSTVDAIGKLSHTIYARFAKVEATISNLFLIPEGRPAGIGSLNGQPVVVLMVVAVVTYEGDLLSPQVEAIVKGMANNDTLKSLSKKKPQ